MSNTTHKPPSIREFLASGGSKEFQGQMMEACAQRGISLDSPWPPPLTVVATPEPEPAPGQKTLTKRQQRQAERAVQIYNTPPTAEDVVFLARELILCTLPHSDPGNVPTWSRTNGNLTLGIHA